MSSYRENNIKILSERLESLQITNKVSGSTNKQIDIEMSTAPVQENNGQAGMPKSMVLDLRQFDRDRTKFEDWQRGIQLFLKSNRVMETDNRITAILACLRKGVADIYVQKKLNELDKKTEIQDWNNFV